MREPGDVFEALFAGAVDRRRFLKGSASGVALLALGSLLPAGCRSYPKPSVPLRFFNSREYAILNAVAARLMGSADDIGTGPNRVDVAAHVDAVVADWESEAQAQLRTMLRVFEHGTYLFDLQRKRFTRLEPTQQDLYLAGWMNSTLGARRIVFRALKALAASGYYADPRAWAGIGYDGPWIGRVDASGRVAPEPARPASALRSSAT